MYNKNKRRRKNKKNDILKNIKPKLELIALYGIVILGVVFLFRLFIEVSIDAHNSGNRNTYLYNNDNIIPPVNNNWKDEENQDDRELVEKHSIRISNITNIDYVYSFYLHQNNRYTLEISQIIHIPNEQPYTLITKIDNIKLADYDDYIIFKEHNYYKNDYDNLVTNYILSLATKYNSK